MRLIRRNGHWIIALFGVACLAWAAGVMAQKTVAPPENPREVSRGIASGHELSAAFSHVAKEAVPAIVSIESQGRAPRQAFRGNDENNPFGENSPFGDMLRNDPRFRDMFRGGRMPRGGEMPRTQSMGSGFIIDPSGIILTNNHVVEDAEHVKVRLYDGREYVASDIKTDPRTDVAILRIKPEGKLHALKLGNSDATQVGEWVLAVGSPFRFESTVTAGIISAKGRGPGIAEREDFLQTDAAINPGNSGGPLLNLHGEVIGINTAISSRSGGYEGIGFAVPINMARWVTDQLQAKGSVSRAYLGVGMVPVNQEVSEKFKVPFGSGVLVEKVFPDSPAALAKVEPDDIIVKLDGKLVHSARELQGAVEQLQIGKKYPLVVLRKGKEVDLTIEAKEMPRDYSMTQLRDGRNNGSPRFNELGVSVEELTPEVARQIGDRNLTGVLITDVDEDSPAAWAGLRDGMVISRVGEKEIRNVDEFKAALKGASLEKGFSMQVHTSRGRSRTVEIRPEKSGAK